MSYYCFFKVSKLKLKSFSLVEKVFDCGEALVGQMKICRFIIENVGGDGRFVILPKSSWPTTNFKVRIYNGNQMYYKHAKLF